MTAALTSLIGVAVDHGLGFAFLVVGGQILLERLMPLEYIASRLFGPRKSVPTRGAHRRVPESRDQHRNLCFSE